MAIPRPKKRNIKPTHIINLDLDKKGTVESYLQSQMTVNYEDGSFDFVFYKDEDVVWKRDHKTAAQTVTFSEYIQTGVTHEFLDEMTGIEL